MLSLLLIDLFLLLLLHSTEAKENGCYLFSDVVRCTNTSMAEVAASLLALEATPSPDCPIEEEKQGVIRLTQCPPPSTYSIRSLDVRDCPRFGGNEVGVFIDLPSSLKSAKFHRCPPPSLNSAYLVELDLSECGLTDVPRLSHLIGLRRLLLRGNHISRLPTSWPASLVELDLTDNRLGENGNSLEGSFPPTLRTVSLAGNGISTLPRLHLETLETLDLRNNSLKGIEHFRTRLLKRMDLKDNPLHCDCGATWLLRLPTTVLLPPCHTPDHLRGTQLEDLQCHPEEAEIKDEVQLIALSASSVEVRWSGKGDGALVYRREADPPHKMSLVSASPSSPTVIRRLRPATSYIVCAARHAPPAAYTIDPAQCRRVQTRPAPRLLDLSVAVTSVRLRWKADEDWQGDWSVRVRPNGGGDSETTHHTVRSEGRLHEYAITGLEPRTDYDVCVEEACVTVHTEGEEDPGMNPAVGLALGLCGAGLVGVAAIALCRRWRRGRVIEESIDEEEEVEESESSPKEAEFLQREGLARNYARSWSTLRLPSGGDHHPPLFRSFRSPCNYRDHLTSVTIYSSGYSEC